SGVSSTVEVGRALGGLVAPLASGYSWLQKWNPIVIGLKLAFAELKAVIGGVSAAVSIVPEWVRQFRGGAEPGRPAVKTPLFGGAEPTGITPLSRDAALEALGKGLPEALKKAQEEAAKAAEEAARKAQEEWQRAAEKAREEWDKFRDRLAGPGAQERAL